jgi:hypothetical protein
MGGYTRAVSEQRLGKHVASGREELCFQCGPCRDGITEGTRLELSQLKVSSVRESVKGGPDPGGRGIAIVGVVIRKRLVTD